MDENKILIDNFSSYLRRKNKTKSTITAYIKDIEQLAEATQGKNFKLITEEDIRFTLKNWVYNGTFSTKTVSRKLNSIRTFYNFLIDKKEVIKSPAESIHHPKFRSEKPRVLTKAEFLLLRETCSDNLKALTMFEILLQTGIRIGELSRIKIKDVNLTKDQSLYISEFSSIKERKVPLNDKVAKALKLYLSSTNKKSQEAPLFSTRNGKYIQIRNIRSSLDKLIKKSKIKDICVNDIRNTFITYQLTHGMGIERLAEIVGHKTVVTTNRYLVLLNKPYKDKKITKVAEL